MTTSHVFLYRADPETLKAIRLWAAEERRSGNGQIEFLLREALRSERRWPHEVDRLATAGNDLTTEADRRPPKPR